MTAVHAIWASRDVPMGRVYRQWNACGLLLLWVNPDVFSRLPESERPLRTPLLSVLKLPRIGTLVIDGDYNRTRNDQ